MSRQVQTYSNELLLALRMRDVPGPHIAEALAEVDSHVSETGEDPREAFGPPAAYAAQVAEALGGPAGGNPWWRLVLSGRSAAFGLGGAAGAWLLLDGAGAITGRAGAVFGLPPVLPLVAGLVILVVMGVALVRMTRAQEVAVLDPRTGADLAPPMPRWVLPLMLTTPVLTLVVALVVVLLKP